MKHPPCLAGALHCLVVLDQGSLPLRHSLEGQSLPRMEAGLPPRVQGQVQCCIVVLNRRSELLPINKDLHKLSLD